jgi:Spy/CpxP family protein refolding chaperone
MAALNLTDAQKAQHKAIFQAERESLRSVEEQLRKVRITMTAATKSGASEANIDLLASQEAPLLGQLEAIHAKAFTKFYGTLTEDQKAKYEAMTAHHPGPRRAPRRAEQ